MPKVSSYRKSRWLKKQDVEELSDNERQTAVDRITEEEVGDEFKPVCYFRGIEKGWPINMTGLETLEETHRVRRDRRFRRRPRGNLR